MHRRLRSFRRRRDTTRPHVGYLAPGFPPAAVSGAHRMRATAHQFLAQGWDVTVVTLAAPAWERLYGTDPGLAAGVDPAVRLVELPLAREDLDTDLRHFSRRRSADPARWAVRAGQEHREQFPEAWTGGWRPALEAALLDLHRRDPFDLLVTTCPPYVTLAATWRLWEEHRVPYVLDLRDGWSVDVLSGAEAFTPTSVAGRWETRLVSAAQAVWCVNDPTAGHYRDRYPEHGAKVSVVRNGYDEDRVPATTHRPEAAHGLRFGYLGTLTLRPAQLTAVLDAWRAARADEPLLAGATFEVRGRSGAGSANGDNAATEQLVTAYADGVRAGGPVPETGVPGLLASWDVLVVLAAGGRFKSSGVVHEAVAAGMPVLSAHEPDHDASTVLAGSPLWTGPVGFDPLLLAESFRRAARTAYAATGADRAAARAAGRRYPRAAQLEPAVREITAARTSPARARELSA